MPVKVVRKKDETNESLLRRFIKKVNRSGVLRIARKKQAFVSKSEARRLKAKRRRSKCNRSLKMKMNN